MGNPRLNYYHMKDLENELLNHENISELEWKPDGHLLVIFVEEMLTQKGDRIQGLRLDARQGKIKAITQALEVIGALSLAGFSY